MIEQKVTRLRRYSKILPDMAVASSTIVDSGFNMYCALHMGNASSSNGFQFKKITFF
jgi:hypothetical protein